MRPFLRSSWRWLKRAAGVLGILICGLLFALVVIVWRPEWFLTPPFLAKAVKKYGKSYEPRWTAFDLRLKSESFARKRVTLKTDDFCFKDSSGTMKGCFNAIDADLTLKLSAHGVYLTRVTRFDVDGRYLKLDMAHAPAAPKKEKAKGQPNGLAGIVPSSLARVHIDELDVKLPDNTLALQSTTTVTGDLSLSYSSGLALAAQLYYDTPEKGENIEAKLRIESDLFTKGAMTYLRALGTMTGDVEDEARLDARVSQKGKDILELTAKARLINGTRRVEARVTGEQAPGRYQGRLVASVRDSSGTVRELAINGCDADAPMSKKGDLQALKLQCKISAEPAPFGAAPGSQAKKIDATIALDLKVKPKPMKKDYFEALLSASIAPRKGWYEFKAGLKAKLAGRLHELPGSLKSEHDLEASLKVAKFQELVKYLQGTAYAIPAPLHVMTGPAEAFLSSKGDTSKPDQTFVYGTRTDLSSGRQRLATTIDGTLKAKNLFLPSRTFSDRTAVVLKDVRLELPYLKLGTVPAVSVDPRIRTGEEKTTPEEERRKSAQQKAVAEGAAQPPVDYAATIKTEHPIMLYSNINPAPVPIALDLKAAPAGLDGTIGIQPFEAELFKRKGQVDHVTLVARPGSKEMNLDGLVKFHQDEADVQVILLGSTDKPKVVFESEPPMDQQQIIALLLFGKPPDDLDPDQNTTVSNSQSAMATGAFGLASLYLFASTPIQYVGYDPATQTYAMRFSLPGGASLEVGSGADQSKHLTLRKRLARHWAIETGLQRDQEQQRNAVTTFLEWFQRY